MNQTIRRSLLNLIARFAQFALARRSNAPFGGVFDLATRLLSKPAMERGRFKHNSDFEALVLSVAPALRVWALALTRSPWDAQDLVQETFERAFRHFNRFRPGTNIRGWLHRIMFNLFVDKRRRAGHETCVEPAWVDEVPAPTPEPAEAWESFSTEDVRVALGRLPPRFRQVMEIYLDGDCSYRDLSLRFGIPEATVGTRLLRGRQKLRSMLSAETTV